MRRHLLLTLVTMGCCRAKLIGKNVDKRRILLAIFQHWLRCFYLLRSTPSRMHYILLSHRLILWLCYREKLAKKCRVVFVLEFHREYPLLLVIIWGKLLILLLLRRNGQFILFAALELFGIWARGLVEKMRDKFKQVFISWIDSDRDYLNLVKAFNIDFNLANLIIDDVDWYFDLFFLPHCDCGQTWLPWQHSFKLNWSWIDNHLARIHPFLERSHFLLILVTIDRFRFFLWIGLLYLINLISYRGVLSNGWGN